MEWNLMESNFRIVVKLSYRVLWFDKTGMQNFPCFKLNTVCNSSLRLTLFLVDWGLQNDFGNQTFRIGDRNISVVSLIITLSLWNINIWLCITSVPRSYENCFYGNATAEVTCGDFITNPRTELEIIRGHYHCKTNSWYVWAIVHVCRVFQSYLSNSNFLFSEWRKCPKCRIDGS